MPNTTPNTFPSLQPTSHASESLRVSTSPPKQTPCSADTTLSRNGNGNCQTPIFRDPRGIREREIKERVEFPIEDEGESSGMSLSIPFLHCPEEAR